jgi:hypothetical protein
MAAAAVPKLLPCTVNDPLFAANKEYDALIVGSDDAD